MSLYITAWIPESPGPLFPFAGWIASPNTDNLAAALLLPWALQGYVVALLAAHLGALIMTWRADFVLCGMMGGVSASAFTHGMAALASSVSPRFHYRVGMPETWVYVVGILAVPLLGIGVWGPVQFLHSRRPNQHAQDGRPTDAR
jgi:membrane-bound ClpP family serine protease